MPRYQWFGARVHQDWTSRHPPPRNIDQNRYHRNMPMTPLAETQAAVSLFHSLADHTRIAIVRRLASGEARVSDLVRETGLAQSTISEHVACLRDCGLVAGRPEGRQVFYALAHPELIDLLSAAETLLAATGYRVDLCSTYGAEARKR
jgi:DNA-binding transcriptional ArsR family regulator